MQAIQTPGDNRPLPANEEFDDVSVGGSADILNPTLARLRDSFSELDTQIHGSAQTAEQSLAPQPSPSPAPSPAEDDRARLQEAHAQVAALLAERNSLSAQLHAATRDLSQASELVQKQRAALLDARIQGDRQENTIRQLRARTEHYQEAVARLLNLPPATTGKRKP